MPHRTMTSTTDPTQAFLEAACAPRDAAHATGTLERAQLLLAAHPGVATSDIHAAAVLGDDATVRRFLAADPRQATARGGPYEWDPLTHLCFSRYLKLDRARSDGFVRAAAALLDAGASPNTGWFEAGHEPNPVWESVLYGAAGVAHHAPLTRLLLERGADPNDEETPYHAPESYDNGALEVLVESGKLTTDNLAMMLIRKHDWHDGDGVEYLLRHGADPNHQRRWGFTALHHAIARDNHLEIIALLIDHGADPSRTQEGLTATAMAARRGRGDLLELFERREVSVPLAGVDRLIAACARKDGAAVADIREREPHLVTALLAMDGRLLAEFAGNGNTTGVALLLELGVSPGAVFEEGDGYWGVAARSTALHVAAWRMRPDTVKLLLARGAPVDLRDGDDRTPLALAIKACVDSYWMERRSPESVAALLAAGASPENVAFPSGYGEVDDLLRQYGATV
ncbi:MAG: ankyrin repeat-containing protein [Gemmatimonadetes bacterium]|nr:ankyrin repeat-containing protein [Gemmatimonadota bacterium]